jgi:hypothetical protein
LLSPGNYLPKAYQRDRGVRWPLVKNIAGGDVRAICLQTKKRAAEHGFRRLQRR